MSALCLYDKGYGKCCSKDRTSLHNFHMGLHQLTNFPDKGNLVFVSVNRYPLNSNEGLTRIIISTVKSSE